nr:cytochrome c [Verrucomicrobium spinosum]
MMTGKRPSGAPVMPPMPQIRLKRDEAEAVVAYLRSLKPAA